MIPLFLQDAVGLWWRLLVAVYVFFQNLRWLRCTRSSCWQWFLWGFSYGRSLCIFCFLILVVWSSLVGCRCMGRIARTRLYRLDSGKRSFNLGCNDISCSRLLLSSKIKLTTKRNIPLTYYSACRKYYAQNEFSVDRSFYDDLPKIQLAASHN